MIEFHSKRFLVIKSAALCLIGSAVFGGLIMWFAPKYTWLGILVSLVAMILSLHHTFFDQNLRFVVDNDWLQIFRRERSLHEFRRQEITLRAEIKTRNWDSTCKLFVKQVQVSPEDKDHERMLDCSLLGVAQFRALCEALGLDIASHVHTITK